MARRTTIKKSGMVEQQTVDLWLLRLLCNAGVWEDLSVCEMGNSDSYSGYFWFKAFRSQLNWALAINRNEDFMKYGRVARGRFKVGRGTLIGPQDKSFDDDEEGDNKTIVPVDKRLAFLQDRLQAIVEDADSLFDLDDERSNPDTLGEFWRRVSRGGAVKRWLGLERPESVFEALRKLEESGFDELTGFSGPFAENISEIREAFGFSALDTRIFAFLLVASARSSAFAPIMRCFDFSKNATDLIIDITAAALKEDRERIKESLRFDSPLMRSGLFVFSDSDDDELSNRIDFLDESRFHSLLSMRVPLQKLLAAVVNPAPEGELSLEDYDHLPVVNRVLLPYMKKALEEHRKGANVLLYGMPGTGKTQLARTVCKILSANLFEVATEEENNSRGSKSRLQRWKTASAFLGSSENTVLAIDEAEDVFNDGANPLALFSLFGPKIMRSNKGQINQLLESNPLPTFWITNSIGSIDPAMIRRFDLVIEVPTPDAKGRRKIVDQAFSGKLSDTAAERLTQADQLAPAVLCRAAEVASMVGFEKGAVTEEEVVGLVSETLRAQGFGTVPGTAAVLPAYYDPHFVNADMDLVELAHGLKEAGGGRICLYGPPGTGKSAYVAWLAKELGRPLVRKTVAELTSCWVGETEKLIAEAFRQAQRENAVLLLDEADSFLRDRTLSRASWETTQVNEMLAQMEAYSGYFVATTNLLDSLDAASLRRFDLKAKFDFLKPEQAVALAQKQLAAVGIALDDQSASRLLGWRALTPGDYAAVARQSRFRPLQSAADFVARLGEEIKVKGQSSAQKIGFY